MAGPLNLWYARRWHGCCPTRTSPPPPVIGGYWTRTNAVEIDVVGGDRAPIAKELLFVGSVKWLENSPFDRHDLAALHRAAPRSRLLPCL